jgi:hypothetical protein
MSPEATLTQAIRRSLEGANTALKLEKIYDLVEENYLLSDMQKEFTRYKEPRFHHETRAIINQLVEKGEIIRVSRGTYKIV